MQTLPVQPSQKRHVVLCLVLGLCLVPMLWPVFTVLQAAETIGSTDTGTDTGTGTAYDADGDRIVNTADVDDDNDGVPDLFEMTAAGADRDTDRDGTPDRLDLDSDNDGIPDWVESGAIRTLSLSSVRKVGARLAGDVGSNGMLDVFESPVDTGQMAYTLANTDGDHDDIPDIRDLDSDNDGWPDLREAGVSPDYDRDGDARVDGSAAAVGSDGVADILQRVKDQACCDLDGDGADDLLPLNTDLSDLPDFQDLDSDNDGIFDIIELGGRDADADGHVDNQLDVLGGPDGMDDGLLAFPYAPQDANGNGVFDHVEYVSGAESGADPLGGQPQTGDEQLEDGSSGGMDSPGESGGVVLTGLNASGCSVLSPRKDLLLHMLTIISLLILAMRHRQRLALRTGQARSRQIHPTKS